MKKGQTVETKPYIIGTSLQTFKELLVLPGQNCGQTSFAQRFVKNYPKKTPISPQKNPVKPRGKCKFLQLCIQ